MERITAEMTALNETFKGFTPDAILGGERLEYEPAAKVTRKDDYVLYDFAVSMTDACVSDLAAAYRTIGEMENEIADLKAQLSEASVRAENSAGQVQKVLAGQEEFKDAERLLATFEEQLDMLANDKQADKALIADLNAQVQELLDLKDTVPQLEADVNAVLANLRTYFEDEGIPMPDIQGEGDGFPG